jgi:5-methylthioribose kinase
MEINPLDERTAIEFVRENLPRFTIFMEGDKLKSNSIAEGNVNVLFRVFAETDPETKSCLLKQALPYSWRYPDFKMPVGRQRIEHDVLALEAQYCPDLVPKIYLLDQERHILAIEFLGRHEVMREAMIKQKQYPLVARHIGTFMARTLFHTSDLFLSSGEKKEMVPRYINPVLCKVQEDLVFTEPYMEHPNNSWTKQLEPQARQIHGDDELRNEVFLLKTAYMNNAQALLHNDLHTGSIMLNEEDTKVIDPEFAFFGPMGHDIGSYLGNLAMGYAAQEYHAQDSSVRKTYREWIAQTMGKTWKAFEEEFFKLWEEKGNQDWPSKRFRETYVRQLLQDTAGFGATEMMRRIIGMAHVHDFWTITDEQVRAAAESLALNIARQWLMKRRTFTSIDDLVQIVVDARSSL